MMADFTPEQLATLASWGLDPSKHGQGCESIQCNEGGEDYYYAHPSNPQAFCQCSNGTPYEMPCPPGKEYNPELQVCDWPQNLPELAKLWYSRQ